MFHSVPRVPRGKMERFAAICGSKKADLRVGEPVTQSGAYDGPDKSIKTTCFDAAT